MSRTKIALAAVAAFFVGLALMAPGSQQTGKADNGSTSTAPVTTTEWGPGPKPDSRTARKKLTYSAFMDQAKAGEYEKVAIGDGVLQGVRPSGAGEWAYVPEGVNPARKLGEAGVAIDGKPKASQDPQSGISTLSILAILGVVGFFVMAAMRNKGQANGNTVAGGPDNAQSAGKSTVRKVTKEDRVASFDEVAGCDEAKEEVGDVIAFLSDPDRFQAMGARVPKGVLMCGPPGNGKTLLARAMAGESGVAFLTVSGSEFTEMYVGVGAKRVRNMFAEARKSAPCILFIDEFDSLAKRRGSTAEGGSSERDSTLNQLLVELDGFSSDDRVIVVAATNRADTLDEAATRPGRFDRMVQVDKPDVKGRREILEVHGANMPLGPDVDLAAIARDTGDFSGADLANLLNEAALLAAKAQNWEIDAKTIDEARDKVTMGAARVSKVVPEEERRLTAYHEAGHVVVGLDRPGNDLLRKVTIVPRGASGGMAAWTPARERQSLKVKEFKGRMAMAFGGRAAEEHFFGEDEITTAAAMDIRMANKMARQMVKQFGMSKTIGPMDLSGGHMSIGPRMGADGDSSHSEALGDAIDAEVQKMLAEGEAAAKEVMERRAADVTAVAEALLKHGTLDAGEVQRAIEGRPIRDSTNAMPCGGLESEGAESEASVA